MKAEGTSLTAYKVLLKCFPPFCFCLFLLVCLWPRTLPFPSQGALVQPRGCSRVGLCVQLIE